jgi:flagellar assembly protein FliH
MSSSNVIKINDLEDELRSFNLRSFNIGSVKKNMKALSAAGICGDLKEEDIASIEKLISKAKSDAAKIIADSKNEAKKIKENSYNTGYEEGELEAVKNADNSFVSAINVFKNVAADIQNKKDDFAVEHQDMLIHLSMSIAKKIIQHEMNVDEEFVIKTIKSAVRMTMDREKLKIRVNPSDLEICNQKKPDIMKDVDGIKTIDMVADISVGRGGVIVEYALGEIDARIEKQFNEIETELIENL